MNITQLLRTNIRQLQPYTSARDEFTDASATMIFMDANENPFRSEVNRYPDPQQLKLKARLSAIKNISPKQILLGNGSDEVLDLIFRVFCEPNQDNIITLPPTYGMYTVLAKINAVENRTVLLDNNFQPDVNAIRNAIDANTKLLFICSPNNPTANNIDVENVRTLIKNFKGLVVIDEAYIDFSSQKSWLEALDEFPNLIITQTLSKAYGMAGIRLGICYASETIISVLNTIKPPYNINQLTQDAAMARLSEMNRIDAEIDLIIKERHRLTMHLKTIPIIKIIYPTAANFILAKVDDANKRYQQLIAKGIVVRNRTHQPLCRNCLRFTVGTTDENNQLINALKTLS